MNEIITGPCAQIIHVSGFTGVVAFIIRFYMVGFPLDFFSFYVSL